MAEDPSGWDRLTATLRCGLGRGRNGTWRLIEAEGLVGPEGHAAFDEALDEWDQRPPMRGPTRAAFVAWTLREADLVTPKGREPDPHGAASCSRLAARSLRRGRLLGWVLHRRHARQASARLEAHRRRSP